MNASTKPIEPTPEQSHAFELGEVFDRQPGGSIRLGKAYRRKRMLETLLAQGLFSEGEYGALKHYRHHADLADRSPLRDSLQSLLRVAGNGSPPSVELLNAIRVTADCERAAGSLSIMLRAVIVDDHSLSQWAISRHGSSERSDIRNGERVTRIKPFTKALNMAQLDMKVLARRIEAELAV